MESIALLHPLAFSQSLLPPALSLITYSEGNSECKAFSEPIDSLLLILPLSDKNGKQLAIKKDSSSLQKYDPYHTCQNIQIATHSDIDTFD